MGVDVVNISFGGFTDISTPEGALIYQAYIDAAAYARSKGTVIVASAGNEHVRVGAGGRILSHGELTTPGTLPEDFVDPFGQVDAARWGARRRGRGRDQPGQRPVLGQLPAGHHRRPG